jgi:gamma-glutamylputrescine oxidase
MISEASKNDLFMGNMLGSNITEVIGNNWLKKFTLHPFLSLHMQLSVWERETFFAKQDIIIIGSGLVGLWSALELKSKNPTLKITILERGFIPAGASTRNAGFACFGSPTELIHDRNVLGEDRMWGIVEMRYKGIKKMISVLKNEIISFERCGGYEVYDFSTNLEDLGENIAWLNKGLSDITGNNPCFNWADDQLQEFGFSGFDAMIENKLEGYIHSGQLVQVLLKKIQGLGVQVFTNAAVTGWEKVNGNIEVNTSGFIKFTTDQLLVCTNAFTSALLPEKITPARGQVILTAPIEGLKMKGTFHYQEGYYYFRNLGNRILLGGARNKSFDTEATTEMETSELIQKRLEEFIAEHLLPGQSFSIEQRWSGIMGFTEDKQPLIKRVDDNVSLAVACNGMGVALAPVIAEKVCEIIS